MANIVMTEGTTRLVEITCLDEDRVAFDFDGFTVQTYLIMETGCTSTGTYLDTTIEDNKVQFVIPAEASVGMDSGWYEVRIFKDDEVYSVLKDEIKISESRKPDITYHGE